MSKSKSLKVSAYFSAASASTIKKRTRNFESPNISGTTNELLRRYEWLVAESLPDLSNKEWVMLLNVYSGSMLTTATFPCRIASDMMDNINAIDINEIAEPEYAALVQKVYVMSQAEQMAVLDFIEQYWSGDWSQSRDFDEVKSIITNRVGV